jgi:hypothetical protein
MPLGYPLLAGIGSRGAVSFGADRRTVDHVFEFCQHL